MRKYVLGFLMVLFAVSAQADIIGKPVKQAQDANGSIVVWTQYANNGQIEYSRYPAPNSRPNEACPAELWDNNKPPCATEACQCTAWVSRYSFQNFDGMDSVQIEARIKQDVDAFAQSLIAKEFTKVKNGSIDLKGIIGKEFTTTQTDVQVSEVKAYTVKTDGSVVEKALVKPEPQPDMMTKLDELQAKIDLMVTSSMEIVK